MRADAEIAILGGGLAGLAAGHVLTRAGRSVVVLEQQPAVGGLARTMEYRGLRFDLGGHRLITGSAAVERMVREVIRDELLTVERASKILVRGSYFDYPLKPLNALSGLGLGSSVAVLTDYAHQQLKAWMMPGPLVSLQDWVVRHYGRRLYDLFFRPYSEKVWGIDCAHISADWVAQRIQGMTLGSALRKALFRSARRTRTLADRFLYPARGIGAIAEGLAREIEKSNRVLTGAEVVQIRQRAGRIDGIRVRSGACTDQYRAQMFVSSLPLPSLVSRLDPGPPPRVQKAAAGLRYRDLVIVALLVGREQVTDQTWIYFPDPDLAIGRLHEPKNWSSRMALPGITLLVAEHFCFRNDALWRAADAELIDRTATELARLGLIDKCEVYDGCVVRVPHAYPVFEVGYRERCRVIGDYLAGFGNLHLIGRTGAFRYYNMDHAIESGLEAAHAVLARSAACPDLAFRQAAKRKTA